MSHSLEDRLQWLRDEYKKYAATAAKEGTEAMTFKEWVSLCLKVADKVEGKQ